MAIEMVVVFFLLTSAEFSLAEEKTNSGTVKERTQGTKSCIERCLVVSDSVDCSRAKCQHIPNELTNATTKFILRKSRFKDITNNSFKNAPNLQYIDLSHGNIKQIDAGAFNGLVHLTFLNLSYNNLASTDPKAFLSKLTRMRELHLTRTQKMFTFDIDILCNLIKMINLGFGRNQLTEFPRFLDAQNKSLVPEILELNLEYNNIEKIYITRFVGLESLQKLNLKGNRIHAIQPNSFSQLENLHRLELDRNFALCPRPYAFKSNTLIYLSLAEVYTDSTYGYGRCKNRMFNGLSNLQTLNIARSKDLLKVVFNSSKLDKLEILSIPSTGVTTETLNKIMKRNSNLRYLDVSENEISVLQCAVLQNLKLEVLLLRDNWLSVINITTLPEKTWNHLTRVDFSENPLYCDCQIVWFRRWLKKRKNTTVENLSLTRCTGPAAVKDVPIHLLKHPTDEECFSEEPDACLLSVILSIFLIDLVAFLIAILHRLRWFLKYWYFRYKAKAREYQEILDQHQYEFDAFISYSESDSKWVINQLRPRIETEFGLRLCIHHRDWLVGRDIVDNVVDSIAQSRKTLLIVTNAFAVSQWCHFEMTMAQTKLFEDDRDNLILVLLEEVADCNMNPRLELQMQKKTYIEWTDNQIGQQLFWEKLRRAVVKQSTSLINETPPRQLLA